MGALKHVLGALGTTLAALNALWALNWFSKSLKYHFNRFLSFLTPSLGTLAGAVWLQNCQKCRPEAQKRREMVNRIVNTAKDENYDSIEMSREGVLG